MDVCVGVVGGLTPYGVVQRRCSVSACVLLLSGGNGEVFCYLPACVLYKYTREWCLNK
jgi:hypothetical protein